MSDWQDGYDKGYQDGLDDNNRVDDPWLIDMFSGVTDREEEWRAGYGEGYAAGEADRESNAEG